MNRGTARYATCISFRQGMRPPGTMTKPERLLIRAVRINTGNMNIPRGFRPVEVVDLITVQCILR